MNTCLFCGRVIPEGGLICPRCDANVDDDVGFSTIKIRVLLNEVVNVADFVRLVSNCSCEVVAHSHHYSVNAKSLLGMMSLNLSKPVTIEFYEDIPYDIKEGLEKFIVD